MTAPNPESKNYARKLKAGKYNTDEAMVDVKQNGKIKKVKATTKGDGAKSELKPRQQIVKERILKERRREKTGRHQKQKKGKGKMRK